MYNKSCDRLMKTFKITRTSEDIIEEFSRAMAKESMVLVSTFCKSASKDTMALRRHATNFISQYIELLLSDALRDYPKTGATQKEQMTQVSGNFKDIKQEIQQQIANAFTRVMEGYSGMDIDYYCLIKPLPEPINKHMC